jgi:hypothetical protein
LLVLASGCQDGASGPSKASGVSADQFLLAEEPAGANGVAVVKAELQESDAAADVVVVGRIGGIDGQVWDPQQAVFMIVDPDVELDDAEEVGPSHDEENCPFCRAKRKKLLASTAIVEIRDDQGEIPSLDARELFGLREGQTIVARGQGEIDSLGTLIVKASGIHVRD